MSKKLLSWLLFLGFFLIATKQVVFALLDCSNEDPLCPAPPGDCVGGNWTIGTGLIVVSTPVCRCSLSNESCSGESSVCNNYSPTDDYAPEEGEDQCKCYYLDDEYCDQTLWTRCCNPGPAPGTGTPTGGPGDPGSPTGGPATSYITGSIQLDNDAYSSGSFCAQVLPSSISLAGWQVALRNPSSPSASYPVSIQANQFSINTSSAGGGYTVTLDLSGQSSDTNYVCSCPAPVNPSNPYLCQYVGVSSPNYNVNFYLKEYNLSNDSWFQVFGGNYFGRTGITSNVPYAFCSLDANCQAALSVPLTTSLNQNSSGFPIVNAVNSNSILSTQIVNYSHSYLHLAQRINNLNSYAVDTDLNQLSYTYFHKLAEKDLQTIGNGEDLEPLLNDWTNAAWWVANDINYIKVNGNVNIDETQGFNLTNGQQLVVFVDGNLILDDSDTNDSNRKITSVAQGGFLAFFVSGDIIITADVGYELNPLSPSTPIVSNANSNVEGIFVADNNLIIQNKTAIGEVPPDRKFIGAGTFVGWNNVLLNRTFNDNNFGPILNNTQAIENFIYRPDLLANWPVKLKASTSNWREVDPQFIGQ